MEKEKLLESIRKLEKEKININDELTKQKGETTQLMEKVENLINTNTLLEIQANEKSLPIRNILFGFVLGFGFTFLVIFTLWFLSLYTKPIANVYKEIFCTNLLE